MPIPNFDDYTPSATATAAPIPSYADYKSPTTGVTFIPESPDDIITTTPRKHGGIKRPAPVKMRREDAEHPYRNLGQTFAEDLLPAVGGGLGAAAGEGALSVPGAALGGGIGSGVGGLLQEKFPALFGKPKDDSTTGILGKIGSDALWNGALEGGSKIAAAGGKAILARVLSSTPLNKTATVLASREADRLATQGAAGNKILQSPQRLVDGKIQLNQLFEKGFSPTTGAVDAPKLLDELTYNPSKYSAIDPQTLKSTKDFLTAAKDSEPFVKDTREPTVLRYMKGKFALSLGTAAGGYIGGIPGAGLAGASVIVGDQLVKAAVKNPEINALILKSFKTGIKSPEASLLNKTITNALRGSPVLIRLADGTEEKGQVSQDGQVQLMPQK